MQQLINGTSSSANGVQQRKSKSKILLKADRPPVCKEVMVPADKFVPGGWRVLARPRGNPATKRQSKYMDIVTAFDIETTRIAEIEQAVMYVWQWQFGLDCTVIGRTWEDFRELCSRIKQVVPEGCRLVVYVHNLSYEFQFLRGIYDFQQEEVFAIENRRVLKCEMYDCLEFRCSYLHSNMGLATYCAKMGATHGKLSGDEFDYSARRWWYTPLTDRQLEYCCNDVRGLVESLMIEMKHDHDTLYTVPLTSTGYVRNDTKREMRPAVASRVKPQLPEYGVYKLLREAFRGGNTHANRHFAGEIVEDVQSWDRSSSYPDVLCNCDFPVSEFEPAEATADRVIELAGLRGKALLMRVAFFNLRLRNEWWGCPYIPTDKCRQLRTYFRRDETPTTIVDNGRVLRAEYLEITITDVDLRIILDEYEFDEMTPMEVYTARYGKLPRQIVELNCEYYRRKTELKGVAGQELFYLKSKNKLNSIYGMMAQNPVKQSIDFIHGEFVEEEESEEDLLKAANKRAFLLYQWGVWCTAWARYRLEEGIRLAGEGFIYCDTDSVKFIGTADFDAYNRQRREDSKRSGAYATDPGGTTHYMGVYEREEHCAKFATLGAKKYCWEDDAGNLHATIAGVSKKEGGPELVRAGGIAAFRPGFVFHDAGGTESIYNDNPPMHGYTNEDGEYIPITANVVIRDSTYTLGITAEYERLINYHEEYDWTP